MTPEREQRPDEDGEGLLKTEARRCGLDARAALPAAERERLSAAVCARAASLPELAAAGTVMSFASFRTELDTAPLAERVLAAGKTLCLPRIRSARTMEAFRVTDPASDLVAGTWGIPEPREGLLEIPPEEMDIVFVPGSAFDEEGGRCGYGGGFYDTYLRLTRPGTPWVALAFETQLMPRIVCETHDLPVTAIVTETRVIRPG
ncbi:MAG TPA: 5-formyltetrahydrofolate cyclo-ligase [Thermoleophilia bacterium]|nr:5-formyltetrahydrofolate cyclo-ligase [Thermoleophilia bacterium]